MSVEKIEKPGNSFNLFKMFNDESFKESMLGITQAAAMIFLSGKPERSRLLNNRKYFLWKADEATKA